MGDDDDPENDPEYVAAEKEKVDAEELRDVNISKKELTELVAELFEGLLNEGISMESLELETPHKFMANHSYIEEYNSASQAAAAVKSTNNSQIVKPAVVRQIDFNSQPDLEINAENCSQVVENYETNTAIIPVANAISNAETPQTIKISSQALQSEPTLIAVPIPGQPNTFQLAKVVQNANVIPTAEITYAQHPMPEPSTAAPLPIEEEETPQPAGDTRYSIPYDSNYTWEYISIKRHIDAEYKDKFDQLRHQAPSAENANNQQFSNPYGFSLEQNEMLQQQLRIHIQMVSQTFMQTYSHPEFWKLAPKCKEMLQELENRVPQNAAFNAWNLKAANELVKDWEQELSKDTEENKEMMQ